MAFYQPRLGSQAEFQDMGQVTDNQVKVEAVVEHRPLNIIPKPNGPLRLIGNFEIRSASGQTVFRGTGMILCRRGGGRATSHSAIIPTNVSALPILRDP